MSVLEQRVRVTDVNGAKTNADTSVYTHARTDTNTDTRCYSNHCRPLPYHRARVCIPSSMLRLFSCAVLLQNAVAFEALERFGLVAATRNKTAWTEEFAAFVAPTVWHWNALQQ